MIWDIFTLVNYALVCNQQVRRWSKTEYTECNFCKMPVSNISEAKSGDHIKPKVADINYKVKGRLMGMSYMEFKLREWNGELLTQR